MHQALSREQTYFQEIAENENKEMSSLQIELEPAGVEEVEAEGDTLQHIFDLYIPRKDLAKPDSQISNKYLQKIIIVFCVLCECTPARLLLNEKMPVGSTTFFFMLAQVT